METYQARVNEKRERFASLAQANRDASTATYEKAKAIGDMIPFGQPILVGHHSERGHRKALENINNNMRKSIEHDNKAEYYEQKAEGYGTHGISSDNPEALQLLKKKLAGQEADHAKMIAINKKTRAEGKETLPAYMLSNSNGRMKATRDRIALMERAEARPAQEVTREDFTMREDKEEGRILFLFKEIPSEERRGLLKRHGFKWSPTRSAWVRMLNPNGIYATKRLLAVL